MLDTFKKADPGSLLKIQEEMIVRKTDQVILLFSMGSQFDHLIKQILGKLGIYCLVADPASVTAEDVNILNPAGIIVSGGPASVYSNPPAFDASIFDLGIPLLGICLGFQMWAKHLGAEVIPGDKKEYGVHTLRLLQGSFLFQDCPKEMPVLQSHGDCIIPGKVFQELARTEHALGAAEVGNLYGVQFHPEVTETMWGETILRNFCCEICGVNPSLPSVNEAFQKADEIRAKMAGGKKVLIALSGGCDSSIVAYMLKAAVEGEPGLIRGVYIRGIDRPADEANVQLYFGNVPWMELVVVDATEDFLKVLAGKTSMKEKRTAMRSVYKEVLERQIAEFGASLIAQGTLYTDVAESGLGHAGAAKDQIKQHHNVGLGFSCEELTPLVDQVKDTARNLGRVLGVPEELLIRHPFPGPGLVVRIDGEVTAERLQMARQADGIYMEMLNVWRLYETVWQAGAVITQFSVSCTKGDGAAQGITVVLWAVWSVNGFTAQWAEVPNDFLRQVSRRITNEIPGVGMVVWRISDKPPCTIECG